MTYTLDEMDWIRAALWNAIASGLSIHDLAAMAEHASTPQSFDRAVNMLAEATPSQDPARAGGKQWPSVK